MSRTISTLLTSCLLLGSSTFLCTTGEAQVCQLEKLIPMDGAPGDEHGVAVDIDGDQIVVGARWDDDLGPFSGSAYIYRQEAGAWIEDAKLLASDGEDLDFFGSSVALSGDVAVVGAWQDDHDGFTDAGAVYVFRRVSGAWVEEAKLTPDDAAEGDGFGGSVDMDGDVIVVGSIFDDDLGDLSGSSYVFRWNGSDWVQEIKLNPMDGDELDQFGCAVAIDGDVILCGAKEDDELGDVAGSAYVFRYDGFTWMEEAKLLAPDGNPGDMFGSSVSVSSDLCLVGVPRDSDLAVDAGAAYVFLLIAGVWVPEFKLTPDVIGAGDRFGLSVSLRGDQALVGSPYVGVETGAAYLFQREGSASWVQQDVLIASDASFFTVFGFSVAMDDERAVVGAPDDDALAGAAYLFDLDCSGAEFIRGDADGNGNFTGLVDALFLLNYQFVAGSPEPPCADAADTDDNGSVTGIVDAIAILMYQFVPGSPPPASPFPNCGLDPTADTLDCANPPCP